MRVRTSSKKKQALNLNVYLNLHHRSLHVQKKKFEELAKKLLRGIPPLGVITLHYEVCVETKRRLDVMNVGSIIDKYFSDCLTAYGIIVDDDYKHIPRISFSFGGFVDTEHVLVTITEIERRSTPMRVLLDTADIQKALTTYVDGLSIPNANGVQLDYANGVITAEVLFGTTETDAPAADPEFDNAPPKKRGRGGRPKGSKNLPKTEPKGDDNVGTPVQAGAAGSSEGDNLPSADETPSADPEGTEEDIVTCVTPKATKKGNLFGDRDAPSSEDDGQAEATPAAAPVTEEPEKPKKGSIFDA